VPPGGVADGLIYMRQPARTPVTIQASIGGQLFSVELGYPRPDQKRMKESELIAFFQACKNGDALRLTLRRGRVFVGRFSSYDSLNERAWFSTPSGGLFASRSFPLNTVWSAESLQEAPAASVNDHLE